MVLLLVIILLILMIPIFYKLYKEDEAEYWRQFDETYKTKK